MDDVPLDPLTTPMIVPFIGVRLAVIVQVLKSPVQAIMVAEHAGPCTLYWCAFGSDWASAEVSSPSDHGG